MNKLSILLILVLLVSACGGGGGSGGGAKVTPPEPGFRVLSVDPRDGENFVRLDKVIEVGFSAPIISGTIDERSFLLFERVTGRGAAATVTLKSGDRIAVLTPDESLLVNTRYRVEIGSTVISVAGEPLQDGFESYFRSAISNDPPPPPPPPSPKGSLRPVGDMQVGRSSHQSTLLADGRVLITGGFNSSSTVTDTAEIYDPTLEEFARTGEDLSTARGFHAAILRRDGRVLVLGGVTGAGLLETDSVEVYDPATDQFEILASKMQFPRAFHSITPLSDGRMLIAGGTVPTTSGVFSSREAEIYNPASDTFMILPRMSVYRANHTATLLGDGKVLLAGGNSTDKRLEIFDPLKNTFTLLSSELRTARRAHTANRLRDGNVLIMGGGERTAETFVTASNTIRWTPGYPVRDRKDHTANLLPLGHVLYTGGSYVINNVPFFHRTTEVYDPWSASFLSHTPRLGDPRNRHRATLLEPGKILITGGQNLDPTKAEFKSADLYELDD